MLLHCKEIEIVMHMDVHNALKCMIRMFMICHNA